MSVERNDETAFLLTEYRAVVDHANRFLLSTFVKQRSQLLQLKLLFTHITHFQPDVFLSTSFIHKLEALDVTSLFYLFAHSVYTRDVDVSCCLNKPVMGRILTDLQITRLQATLFPKPDYTRMF